MSVRTAVRTTQAEWRQMRDELVDALAERGVLHCAGVTTALLDTAAAVTQRDRDGQAEDAPGAP